jgi:hypothetical protein
MVVDVVALSRGIDCLAPVEMTGSRTGLSRDADQLARQARHAGERLDWLLAS